MTLGGDGTRDKKGGLPPAPMYRTYDVQMATVDERYFTIRVGNEHMQCCNNWFRPILLLLD